MDWLSGWRAFLHIGYGTISPFGQMCCPWCERIVDMGWISLIHSDDDNDNDDCDEIARQREGDGDTLVTKQTQLAK